MARKNDKTILKRGRTKRRERAEQHYQPPEPKTPQYDNRPVYRDFDAYIKDHPIDGEEFRTWLTTDRRGNKLDRKLYLLPAFNIMHGGLPGGYVFAYAFTWHYNERNVPCSPADAVRSVSGVWINDNDDGRWMKTCTNQDEAEKELELLTQLAPFSMSDLCEVCGYEPQG